MQAPWKICADAWAQDLQRQQEAFIEQQKIEATRRQVKDGIDAMIENDRMFLQLLLSFTKERLE